MSNLAAPAYLDDTAKQEFERVAALRPFRQSELATLTLYATAFSAWQREQAICTREGSVITVNGSKGQSIVKENPRLLVAERHNKSTIRAARLLGLHKVVSEPSTEPNEFDEFDD